MKSLVVLPTYNEKDNICELVEKILKQNNDIGVVIVDDNSPDNTGKTADELARSYPGRVKVIHRTGKRGRGLAGIEGFKYALEQKADYIFEMDADLSHRPDEIPDLLKYMADYDIVIGSRYIDKTSGDKEAQPPRNSARKLISFLARYYLRLILNIKGTDPASGFRCFRQSALIAVDPATLTSQGPSIITEILYRCYQKNLAIAEVPIIFEKRRTGDSKLTLKILLSCLILPLKYRIKQIFLKKIDK